METKYSILTKLLKNLKTSVLPSGTAANAGKVATIGETGEWEAANPSGGSGGGVLVVHADEAGEHITLDKTWQDIMDAMTLNGAIIATEESGAITSAHRIDKVYIHPISGNYVVRVGESQTFVCLAPDDYPVLQLDNYDVPVS